ncbi:L-fucose:H+ symporter permease [Mannheimia massilioguelmaensis]
MATYTMFLAAIFSIAIGLSFLETSANTYSSMIGHKDYATLRLNISQTFYPVGAISGILLGKYLIFQEGASLNEQMATMNPEQLHAFKLSLLEHTLQPYKYLIFVLLAVMFLFLITSYPKCKAITEAGKEEVKFTDTLKYLATNSKFKKGIVAQFLYVGMQVAVWSFTIRLALNLSNMNERDASNFMIYSFIGFFVGKFVANFLMTKFKSDLVLLWYSILGVITLAYTAFVHDFSAVYAAIFASVLFGPCWATIYASVLGTVSQEHREVGGAVVVMSIIGAAVVPAIHGYVSDTIGSLQLAFIVPLFCFAYVGYYFYGKLKETSEGK